MERRRKDGIDTIMKDYEGLEVMTKYFAVGNIGADK